MGEVLTAGSLWVAVRAGPCLLPQTHTAERPGGRGHLHTLPHDMGAAYKCSHSALAPMLQAAESPYPSRSIPSYLTVQSLLVGSKAGQARPGCDSVLSCPFTGLSFLICPQRLI